MKYFIKYIVFGILAILPITDLMFISSEVTGETLNRYSFYMRIGALIVMSTFLLWNPNDFIRIFRNPVVAAMGSLLFYILLHFLFTYESAKELSLMVKIIYNFIAFFFFYLFAYNNDIKDSEIKWLYAIMSILILYTILIWIDTRATLRAVGLSGMADNKGYALVGCFPMLLLFYKERKFPFLILLVSIGVLIAAKRGAIFCLISSIIVMILFVKKNGQIRIGTKMLYSITIIVGFVLLVSYYNEYLSETIVRINKIVEDGGSGRNSIYAKYWNGFLDYNVIQSLFGSGLYGGIKNLNVSVLAHSDWLEILYDYGICGILLYINVFLRLGRYIIRQFRIKDMYYYILLSTSIILFIKSIISGTFLMTVETSVLYIPMAYILGKNDKSCECNYDED